MNIYFAAIAFAGLLIAQFVAIFGFGILQRIISKKLEYGIQVIFSFCLGTLFSVGWMLLVSGRHAENMDSELAQLGWQGVIWFWGISGFLFVMATLGFLQDKGRFPSDKRLNQIFESIIDAVPYGTPIFIGSLLLGFVLAILNYLTLWSILLTPIRPFWNAFRWIAENDYQRPFMSRGNEAFQALWDAVSSENGAGLFAIYIAGILFPYWLFLAPYKWCRFKERLSENSIFRRVLVIGKGGSARWAGPQTYRTGSGRAYNPKGILFGRTEFLDTGIDDIGTVGLDDDSHLLTVGCQGSGKSVSVIWPNLALYQGGAVVLDPKGEHANMTFWLRAQHRKVNVQEASGIRTTLRACKLDPFNQAPDIPGCSYNPLSEIDLSSDRIREQLAAISDGCVLPEGDKNRHWTEGAKTVIEGFIAHVLTKFPEENHNLPFVHDLLVGFDPELGIADPEQLDDILLDMRLNTIGGGICAQAATIIGHREGDAFASMMATIQRSVKWIGDPAMRAHLSGSSEFSFAQVPNYGKTVYIVSPLGQLMSEQLRWLRVLTNLGISRIRQQPTPPTKTLFILDEFPQLGGQLSAIKEGIVTLRSAGIRLWPFIQQIGQMKKDYGDAWNTFVSSANVQVFGVTDNETAEWLSTFLGEYTHARTEKSKITHEASRSLWTPREVMDQLGKSTPLQVVLPNDGGFPMRLERIAFKPLIVEGHKFRSVAKVEEKFEGHC